MSGQLIFTDHMAKYCIPVEIDHTTHTRARARTVPFSLLVWGSHIPAAIMLIGERARHSQVCSTENRGYIYIIYIYIVRANFVLITRKEGGA